MKKERWEALVAEYQQSGMRQADFAKKHKIKAASLSWHLNKAKWRKPRTSAKPKGGFIQIGAPDVIEIEARGGVKLKVPATISAAALKQIVEALNA